jgi:hypothetical protein
MRPRARNAWLTSAVTLQVRGAAEVNPGDDVWRQCPALRPSARANAAVIRHTSYRGRDRQVSPSSCSSSSVHWKNSSTATGKTSRCRAARDGRERFSLQGVNGRRTNFRYWKIRIMLSQQQPWSKLPHRCDRVNRLQRHQLLNSIVSCL